MKKPFPEFILDWRKRWARGTGRIPSMELKPDNGARGANFRNPHHRKVSTLQGFGSER